MIDPREEDRKGITTLANINVARKMNGLPPIVRKKMDCLRCEFTFDSSGPSNRLCLKCTAIRSDRF